MEDNKKEAQSNKPKVVIYTTPSCQFCHLAKDYFKEKNVEFTEYNVAEDDKKRQEMIEKSGQMAVPVIYVNEKLVIGFDQQRLQALLGL